MQAKELAKRLKGNQPPCVVDVRSGVEFRSGHIPDAVHVPFWSVLLQRSKLPGDRETLIVVTCEHGPRAQLAAVQLGWAGYRKVDMLAGHMAGWRRNRLPLKR